jgi:hypothetical protein
MGPFPIKGMRGELHVVVLVDEFSGFGAAVPITTKDKSPFVVQRMMYQWSSALTGFVMQFLRSEQVQRVYA